MTVLFIIIVSVVGADSVDDPLHATYALVQNPKMEKGSLYYKSALSEVLFNATDGHVHRYHFKSKDLIMKNRM